ncbi:DUF4873 domain-containing protein [Mycobacterium simiae]|uniref:DUF4873 domain-containing protein n=1 Tax=Mycobacterium simiae TaxID=1784 RepID=UPI0021CDD0B9|nr:DUF4873 domain-containing protein [Mycobacterium simiae]
MPWIPNINGCNKFEFESFHAAAWLPDFDPAGKRIALIGTDSITAHYFGRLAQAASVTLFPFPPRRVVTEVPRWSTRAKRWLGSHIRTPAQRPSVALAGSAIDTMTSARIRTRDGVEHPVDTVIYGTGFSIADHILDQGLVGARGLTIQQVWDDGMEPFFGVAVYGFPNYFFLTGPDTDMQARYIAEGVRLMHQTRSSRIQVRGSSQQVFNERAQLKPAQPPPVLSAFDLSYCAPHDDAYDGDATLEVAGIRHSVQVRLRGHFDPIDGNYHWQGTVFDRLPHNLLHRTRAVTVTVGQRSAPARIVEQTPWGGHCVSGVGVPPYMSSDQ